MKPTKSTRRQQEVAPIVDDAADMSQDLPAPGAKAVEVDLMESLGMRSNPYHLIYVLF